jgi:hypothetical protein
MRPLTLDDLIPLEEYASQRREYFETLERYLDRYRRVRIGPQVTLLFENRQTLWFRVQEVLRIARLAEPARVQQELDVYNRLLPTRGHLQAVLLTEACNDEAGRQPLRGGAVQMLLGDRTIAAEIVTNRPEDISVGAAQWVRFAVDAPARERLSNSRYPALIAVQSKTYHHRSAPLSSEIRESLLEDLQMSDKDATV